MKHASKQMIAGIKWILSPKICFILFGLSTLQLSAQCETIYQKWAKEIIEFDHQDKSLHPTADQNVLFVGSSTFRMWTNVQDEFPKYKIINRGFGGSHLADLLCLYTRLVQTYQPQKVFLYEGENDLSHKEFNIQTYFQQLDQFAALFQADFPEAELYLVGIKPSPCREASWPRNQEANAYMRKLASENPNIVYIDTWTPLMNADGSAKTQFYLSDQLHLNKEGYAVWANCFKRHLK